jgi:hypothetical protein
MLTSKSDLEVVAESPAAQNLMPVMTKEASDILKKLQKLVLREA